MTSDEECCAIVADQIMAIWRCRICNLVGPVDTKCWYGIKLILVEIDADGDNYVDTVSNVEEGKSDAVADEEEKVANINDVETNSSSTGYFPTLFEYYHMLIVVLAKVFISMLSHLLLSLRIHRLIL